MRWAVASAASAGGLLLIGTEAAGRPPVALVVMAGALLLAGAAGAARAALARRSAPATETVPPRLLLRRELDRSRRHEHPCALIRLPDASSADDVEHLTRGLRRIDDAWIEGADLYVLLPETDGDGAQATVRRVVPEEFSAAAHVAAFPADALTGDALLRAVQGNGERSRATFRRAMADRRDARRLRSQPETS